jgi:hypothetical protein
MFVILVRGFSGFALLFECCSQTVQTCFPQLAVLREPLVQLAEGLGQERIKPPLSLRTHRNEARFGQDTKMPRNTGLVDASLLDDVVDLLLTAAERFDDAAARRVGERLETV